jgi:predicted nucleotidyltransferase component of viral defense system
MAFQGGTSLNMSWGSPRFSEDIDLLLSRLESRRLVTVMRRCVNRVNQSLAIDQPKLTVSLHGGRGTDATQGLAAFELRTAHPDRLGKARVKVEFWRVDPSYLDRYETVFRLPVRQGEIITRSSTPIAAATREAAYADKITAFATRPGFKARDMFDFWWLGQQVALSPEEAAERFLNQVEAYTTVGECAPADALRAFLQTYERAWMLDTVKKELPRWLPEKMWESLGDAGAEQMVDYTRRTLETVAQAADEIDDGTSDP